MVVRAARIVLGTCTPRGEDERLLERFVLLGDATLSTEENPMVAAGLSPLLEPDRTESLRAAFLPLDAEAYPVEARAWFNRTISTESTRWNAMAGMIREAAVDAGTLIAFRPDGHSIPHWLPFGIPGSLVILARMSDTALKELRQLALDGALPDRARIEVHGFDLYLHGSPEETNRYGPTLDEFRAGRLPVIAHQLFTVVGTGELR